MKSVVAPRGKCAAWYLTARQEGPPRMSTDTWTRDFYTLNFSTGDEALVGSNQQIGFTWSPTDNDTLLRVIVDLKLVVEIHNTTGGGPAGNWWGELNPMFAVGIDEVSTQSPLQLSNFLDPRVTGTGILNLTDVRPDLHIAAKTVATYQTTTTYSTKGRRRPLIAGGQPECNTTVQAYPATLIFDAAFTWTADWWVWVRALWRTP